MSNNGRMRLKSQIGSKLALYLLLQLSLVHGAWKYPLTNLGTCSDSFPCGKCVGSCSLDSHCAQGLKCLQRQDLESVPGCREGGQQGMNYCYNPEEIKPHSFDPTDTTNRLDIDSTVTSNIQFCKGSCENDGQCNSALLCSRRDEYEEVPGCQGRGRKGENYCYEPSNLDPPLTVLAQCSPESTCQKCIGFCSSDDDCANDLICYKGESDGKIPGCQGNVRQGIHYCFHPDDALPHLREVDDCSSSNPCDECNGFCQSNDECSVGRLCFIRSAFENIPGCHPGGESARGYCYKDPTYEKPMLNVGDCTTGQCGECMGDCDGDAECEDGLRCFHRSDLIQVPGCQSGGDNDISGKDYCFKPTKRFDETINYVGECGEENYTCRRCEGDCDAHDTCEPGLYCMSRDGTEAVPGCLGTGYSGDDICYDPQYLNNPLSHVDCAATNACGVCEGYCDNDSQCTGDLKCFQREGMENVPGCQPGGVSGKGYCYNAEELPILHIGNCSPQRPCTECMGDCDYDNECESGLVCFERNGLEDIPGCLSGGESAKDYCYRPQIGVPLTFVGECSSSNPCGQCEGGCFSDSHCGEGLSCFQYSGLGSIPGCYKDSSFNSLVQNYCHNPTVFSNSLKFVESCNSTHPCNKCEGACYSDTDCGTLLSCFERYYEEPVPGCVTGGFGDIRSVNYCYESPVNGDVTYVPGDLISDGSGLELSKGLESRIIASSGSFVNYTSSASENPISSVQFHSDPDGAAVFSKDDGSWIYLSNSKSESTGGVGAVVFDVVGEVISYSMVATNTKNNSGGGKTFWGTWVSCEENGSIGKVHEVDPFGKYSSNETLLGGSGGNFASFSYDNRNVTKPKFFVTHDSQYGGLRRFTPSTASLNHAFQYGDYSKVLTIDSDGTSKLEWLVLEPDPNNSNSGTFFWSAAKTEGDASANQFYPHSEGIDQRHGKLYFTSKTIKKLFILDLDQMTYTSSSTESGAFDQHPELITGILGHDNKDILYFCEDGGTSFNSGVHGRDTDGNFYTIINGKDYQSETTGLAFSPDRKRMYVSYPKPGVIYEIRRTDGYPFGGQWLDIKYHNSHYPYQGNTGIGGGGGGGTGIGIFSWAN